jgi:hypothetical protein
VTAGAVCDYVVNGSWLVSFDLVAGDTFQNYALLPGEGVRAQQKVYALMTGLYSATVFYG